MDVSRAAIGWLVAAGALVLAAAAAIWWVFWGSAGGGTVASVTPAQVLADPGRYAGHVLVVQGGMGRKLGPHAFTLGEPVRQAPPPSRLGLLVVAKDVPGVAFGHEVRVQGRIVFLRAARTGRELPYRVSRRTLRRFRGGDAVVASSVSVPRR